jgi:hypothetical protein
MPRGPKGEKPADVIGVAIMAGQDCRTAIGTRANRLLLTNFKNRAIDFRNVKIATNSRAI